MNKGIALEFNPFSNWCVSGAHEVDEIPYQRIIRQMKDGVLAMLNTDNPGFFGTRIEIRIRDSIRRTYVRQNEQV